MTPAALPAATPDGHPPTTGPTLLPNAGALSRPALTTATLPATGPSVFWPLLLLSLAFCGWVGFQSAQLVLEHRQLSAAGEALVAGEQQSVAVRRSLDSLASATAKLADTGNPNARRIVDELRRRGITINPAAGSATGTPP